MFAVSSSPQMLQALALIFGIGTGLVIVFIGLSIAAFILKTACRTAGADVPDTGRAMVVSFLESVVGGVVYLASVVSVGVLGAVAGAQQTTMAAAAGLSAVSVTFLVPAGLYVPMLRVTFKKGLVISVLRYVITLVLVVGLAAVVMAATGKFKLK